LPRLRPLACFIMIQAPLAAVMGATIAATAIAGFANNGKIAFTPLE